jgi:hypothetical protein
MIGRALRPLNLLRGLRGDEVKLVVLLGAGSFMLMSNLSSINVALPHIQRDFDTSLSDIKWVSIVGFIVAASLSLCFGRVGDVEPLADDRGESDGILDFGRTAALVERPVDILEVGDVGAMRDCGAQPGWLDWVLAAMGHQRAAHEDGRHEPEDKAQLAD